MGAPITHVVLTKKVFPTYFSQYDLADFIVGTSFPDIRYLRIIKREQTHLTQISWQQISAENDSFIAGVKFHVLVDQVREKFMQAHHMYDLFPQSPHQTQAVKIFEDQCLYDQLTDWRTIIDYFNQIHPGELKFGLKEADLMRWHQLLQTYFQQAPDETIIRQFIRAIDQPVEMAKNIIHSINHAQTQPAAQIVTKFDEQIEELLEADYFCCSRSSIS